MKKVKRIAAIVLACTTMLGTVLSVSAATTIFYFVPSDYHCLNSGCGYAPLRQDLYGQFWYCPDVNCGWQYWEQY